MDFRLGLGLDRVRVGFEGSLKAEVKRLEFRNFCAAFGPRLARHRALWGLRSGGRRGWPGTLRSWLGLRFCHKLP